MQKVNTFASLNKHTNQLNQITMSLNPNQATQRQRKLIPEGSQPARCYAIVDIGKHYFQGKTDKDPISKVMFCFELTKHMHKFSEDSPLEPLTVNQEHSFAIGDKANLPKMLKSWGRLKVAPTKLDLKPYLGQYCMLGIEHTKSKKNDNVYSNIEFKGLAVKPFEGTTKPNKFHKDIWFDLDAFSWDAFNKLPYQAKSKIKESASWPAIIAKFPEPINQEQQPVNSVDEEQFVPNDGDSPNF